MPNGPSSRRLGNLTVFSSLKHRDYRMLWLSNLMGGGSQWAMMVGRAWLVFELSDSALWVAVITFSAFLGSFVMIPFGGILADRVDRRNLVMYSLLSPFVVNIVLAVVTLVDVVEVWQVVILSFAASLTRAAGLPASRALTPSLVPRDDLLNAVAMGNVAMRGPRLGGPLLAAPLLATVGVEGVFIGASVFYALSALQLLRMRRPPQEAARQGQGMLGDFAEGLQYIGRNSMVGLIVAIVAFHCALTMSFDPLLPTFVKHELGAEGDVFSYMFMAVGAGGLIGTLSTAALWGQRIRGQLLLITGLLSGLTMILMATATTLPLALIALIVIGGTQAMFMALTEAVILETVPDRLRGRVLGIYFMIAVGVMAVATLVNGLLADIWGVRPIFLAPGLLFVAFMGVVSGVRPSLRQVYRTGSIALTPGADSPV